MREIKFRAWDDKEKKWLLGYELNNLGGFSLYGECVMFGEWGNVVDQFLFGRDGRKPDDLKVMQYTGLKDKNGVDIYEGDIVRSSAKTKWTEPPRFVVEWEQPQSRFVLSIPDSSWHGLEQSGRLPNGNEWLDVIGNIYENPELLK